MAKLTAKQEMFAIAYVKCLNATQAYKEAYGDVSQGTAEVNGSKLLNNTKVQDRIDDLMLSMKSSKIASAEEVLEFLTGVMQDSGEKIDARIRSAELLGKRHKLFTDKVETTGSLDIEINLGFDEEEDE